MYACFLAFQWYIDCFSSFINSRVIGFNVAVSVWFGSKFSDLYLQWYLTKIFILFFILVFLHEPTTVLNFIKIGVRWCFEWLFWHGMTDPLCLYNTNAILHGSGERSEMYLKSLWWVSPDDVRLVCVFKRYVKHNCFWHWNKNVYILHLVTWIQRWLIKEINISLLNTIQLTRI